MNCERIREQIPEALAGQLDKAAHTVEQHAEPEPAPHVGRQPMRLLAVVAPRGGALEQVAAVRVAEQPAEKEIAVHAHRPERGRQALR